MSEQIPAISVQQPTLAWSTDSLPSCSPSPPASTQRRALRFIHAYPWHRIKSVPMRFGFPAAALMLEKIDDNEVLAVTVTTGHRAASVPVSLTSRRII